MEMAAAGITLMAELVAKTDGAETEQGRSGYGARLARRAAGIGKKKEEAHRRPPLFACVRITVRFIPGFIAVFLIRGVFLIRLQIYILFSNYIGT